MSAMVLDEKQQIVIPVFSGEFEYIILGKELLKLSNSYSRVFLGEDKNTMIRYTIIIYIDSEAPVDIVKEKEYFKLGMF